MLVSDYPIIRYRSVLQQQQPRIRVLCGSMSRHRHFRSSSSRVSQFHRLEAGEVAPEWFRKCLALFLRRTKDKRKELEL